MNEKAPAFLLETGAFLALYIQINIPQRKTDIAGIIRIWGCVSYFVY
jgi:hypothetical protein